MTEVSYDFITLSEPIMEVLDAGLSAKVYINGVSMCPLLYPNRDSVILAKPTRPFRKYDVVLVREDNGRFYLHRIVKLGDTITLNGDGEICLQKDVKYEDVYAIATAFVHKDKTIQAESKKQKFYARVWWFLKPLRRGFLFVMRRI